MITAPSGLLGAWLRQEGPCYRLLNNNLELLLTLSSTVWRSSLSLWLPTVASRSTSSLLKPWKPVQDAYVVFKFARKVPKSERRGSARSLLLRVDCKV